MKTLSSNPAALLNPPSNAASLSTLQNAVLSGGAKPKPLADQLRPLAPVRPAIQPTGPQSVTGSQSLTTGGCIRNDGWERCPPPPPPWLDCGGGVGPFYQFHLQNMTDSQLQEEKFNQELNLLVSLWTGDSAGAYEAQQKLQAIKKEELRRMFGGGQLEMAIYKRKLDGMSNFELKGEERKQQVAYLRALLTGDMAGAARAKEKLAAVHQEQFSRRFDPFPLPWDRMMS